MSLMKHSFSTESADRRLSIAFLDTGISPVEDFILPENRIVAFRDFINGRTEPYDDNGHGTQVTKPFSYFYRNLCLFMRCKAFGRAAEKHRDEDE